MEWFKGLYIFILPANDRDPMQLVAEEPWNVLMNVKYRLNVLFISIRHTSSLWQPLLKSILN
jgi:hypothetical protein